MLVRPAHFTDVDGIMELFAQTIFQVNAKDYSTEQLQVWAETSRKERWKEKIDAQHFLIAEHEDQMLGFGSIDTTGYLDYLYVHHKHQGEGIGSTLLTAILQQADKQKNESVWTSASITARPFFEKSGFEVVELEKKHVEEVEFVNFIMKMSI